jgi:hypothetical protein
LTSLLLYNYYYRYREKRKQVKNLVDSNNNVGAKTMLESAITEHNSFYNNGKKDFNYGEKIMMEHAKRHLDDVIDKNDPEFLDGITIKHHSDIVKSALLQTPKTEY